MVLWDVVTGEPIHVYDGNNHSVSSVAFNPNGQYILAGGCSEQDNEYLCTQGEMVLWDVVTGEPIRSFHGHTSGVSRVAFSPDGEHVLTGGCGQFDSNRYCVRGELVLWNVATGEPIRRFHGHTRGVPSIAFSPDGRTVLSGSADYTMILWDVATGDAIHIFRGDYIADSVAFSPDGKSFLAGYSDGLLILWDILTHEPIRTFVGHSGPLRGVTGVAFSPDGNVAVSSSRDRTLILWDVSTGEPIRMFHGHKASIQGVAFGPDEQTLVSISTDTIIIWDIVPGEQLQVFQGRTGDIRRVAFSPDGQYIITGGCEDAGRLSNCSQGELALWDLAMGEPIRTFHGHNDAVLSVAISPDGNTVLSGARDGTLILWDIATGEPVRTFDGPSTIIESIAFSPDGYTALASYHAPTLILWDIATGEPVRTFNEESGRLYYGPASSIYSIAFSPDGKTVLTGQSTAPMVLWDVSTGEPIHSFQGHTNAVLSIAFSPDGNTAVSGSVDETIILWDVATGEPIHTFRGHTDVVHDVYFSPDARMLLSGSQNGELFLWDIATGEPIRSFQGHTRGVLSAAFSPDGKTAVSTQGDSQVFLWRIDTLQELVSWTYSNRYVLELMCDERRRFQVEPFCDEDENYPLPTRPSEIENAIAKNLHIRSTNSSLSDTITRYQIDLTGEDNVISWQYFEGVYNNFVAGATIQWGPGAADDTCGFLFRTDDNDNFYIASIDQEGRLWFKEETNGYWLPKQFRTNHLIETGQDSINEMVLIVIGDTFVVYVNGEYSGLFQDQSHPSGRVALQAGTYDDSNQTYCVFTDAWIRSLTDVVE